MSNILQLNTSQVLSGLATMTYTVPTTGVYSVLLQCTELPPSGISIVVNQNGSPVYTAPSVSPTQGALQFRIPFYFTAADAITVVLSSSTANDLVINNVKSNIIIQQGQ